MPKKNSAGNSKTREWERKRRQRLNDCFSELEKLLPNHDPASAGSKIKILESASKYIQSLQKENQELVDGNGNSSEIKLSYVSSLRRRVKALVSRVRQLAGLLRAAGITVPESQDSIVEEPLEDGPPPIQSSNLPPALGPRPMRWSNKIKPQDAAMLLEKVQALKRAKKSKKVEAKKAPKKLTNTTKPLGISNKSTTEPPRRRTRRPPKAKEKTINSQNQADDKNRTRYILVHKKELHKCIMVPAGTPAPLPSTTTPNNISLLGTSTTLLVTPTAPPTTVNSSLSLIMPPRPLILTNASLLPAVIQPAPTRFIQVGAAPPVLPPPPPPQLPPPPPQPPPNLPTIPPAPFPLSTQTFNCSNFALLAPKRKDSTRTTTANKKPISALKPSARSKTSKKIATNGNKSKSTESEKKDKDDSHQSSSKKRTKDKDQTELESKKKKLEKEKEITKENEKSKNYTIDAICKSKETIKEKNQDNQKSSIGAQNKEIVNNNISSSIANPLPTDTPSIKSSNSTSTSSNILTSTSILTTTSSSFDNSSIYTPYNITTSKIHCPMNSMNSRTNCNSDIINNESIHNLNINEDYNCNSNTHVNNNNNQNNNINTSSVNISSNVMNNIITSNSTTTTSNSNDIILNMNNEKTEALNKEKKSEVNSLESLETNKKSTLDNTFTPIPSNDHLDAQSLLQNSDYAGDLFASLNVSSGSHHPELISPTAAFLLAFPLVSTSKNTENDVTEEPCQDGASTLLQISNLDNNSIINCVARDHMDVTKDPISLPPTSDKEQQDHSKNKWIENTQKNVNPKPPSQDSNTITKNQDYIKHSNNMSYQKNIGDYSKENNSFPKESNSISYTKEAFVKDQNSELQSTYKNSDSFPKDQNIFAPPGNIFNKTGENYNNNKGTTNNFNKEQEAFNKEPTNSFTKEENPFNKSQNDFFKNTNNDPKEQNSYLNMRNDFSKNQGNTSFSKETTQNVFESDKNMYEKSQNFSKQQKQNFQKDPNTFQIEQNNFSKNDDTQNGGTYKNNIQPVTFLPKDSLVPNYNSTPTQNQFPKNQQTFNKASNFPKDQNMQATNSNLQFRKNEQIFHQKGQQIFSEKEHSQIFQQKAPIFSEKEQSQIFPIKNQSQIFSEKNQSQIFSEKDQSQIFPIKNQSQIFSEKNQSQIFSEKNQSQIFSEKNQSQIFSEKNQSQIFSEKNQSQIFSEKDQSQIFSEKNQSQMFSEKNSSQIFSEKDQSQIFSEKNQSQMFSEKNSSQIFSEKNQSQMLSEKNHSQMFSDKNQSQLFSNKNQSHLFPNKNHSQLFPEKNPSHMFSDKDHLQIFQQKDQHIYSQKDQTHIFPQKDQQIFQEKDTSIFQQKDQQQMPSKESTQLFQQKDPHLFTKDQHIFNKEQMFQKEQFSGKNSQETFFLPEIRTKEDANLFATHQFPTQAPPTLPTFTQTQSQPNQTQQQANFQTSHTLPDITNAQFENFKLSKNQQVFDFGLEKRPSNQNAYENINSKQSEYSNILTNKNMNQEFHNNKEATNKDKNLPVSNPQIKMYNNYPTTYPYMFNDFSSYSSNYTQATTTQNNTKTTSTSANFMSWNPVSVAQTPSTSTFDNFTMKTNLLPDTIDLNLDFGNIDKNRKLPDFFPSTFTNEELRTDFQGDFQTNLPNITRNEKDQSYNTSSINSSNNKTNQKPPVNWMTAPDPTLRSSMITEETPKDLDFTTNNYNNNFFNNQSISTTTCDQDFTLWPSRKMLGADLSNALFTPSTLPTLVGDLALGTNFSMSLEETGKNFSVTFDNEKEDKPKQDKSRSNNNKKPPTECPPFLSVSQLVDPKAKNQKRRQQVNQSHKQSSSRNNSNNNNNNKRQEPRKDNHFDDFNCRSNQWQGTDKRFQRNNSYSAEALIGVSSEVEHPTKVTNIPPPMVTEKFAQPYTPSQPPPPPRSALATFPSTTSDTSFNYLSSMPDMPTTDISSTYNNNNTTFSYAPPPPTGSTSAPVYSSNTMAPFLPDNNDQSFMFPQTHQSQQQQQQQQQQQPQQTQTNSNQVQQTHPPSQIVQTTRSGCSSNSKTARNRRKPPEPSTNIAVTTSTSVTTSTGSGISGLVDLGYLSLPHTIQSPILDESASILNHGSGLMPPNQTSSVLYQPTAPTTATGCPGKNQTHAHLTPLPPPGLSTTSSLTNFNLSTIFPEINDKVPSYGPSKLPSQNHTQRHQQGPAAAHPPINGIWPT